MKATGLIWILFLAARLSAQTITTQPTNQIVLAGSTVTFSVAVSGVEPFTYQWQYNGNNLGIISTVAGNGTYGFSGDGSAATNAKINYPYSVAVDASGDLFIADLSNNRIRKVDTNGIITTVAGNGPSGTFGTYSGDGGAATNAGLNFPSGVAVDSKGNVFIADEYNGRVRKVDTNGIIITVAGGGSGSDGGAATNASLNRPWGVVLDAVGNLFIGDLGNNRVRKVDANGIITTVAGNGSASFSGDGGAATNASLNGPTGVAVDAVGNLFIADYENERIRKVDTNGIITTVAGIGVSASYSGDGGAATNANLAAPIGVAVDTNGNIFVADSNNGRIRKVNTNGIITTVAGSGGFSGYSSDGEAAISECLDGAYGVAVDTEGNLFIAASADERILKVTSSISSPALILNNVFPSNNNGNYSVVVTGSSGSVTSSVVTLSVLTPTTITAPTMLTNGQFQFSFDTTTSENYAVQYSTNLIQWFSLVTLGGIGEPLTVTDPNTTGSQQRFYRISLSPQ